MQLEIAKSVAERVLPGVGTRLAHTRGVVESALLLASALQAGEEDVLVAAAWWHDVGYAPDVRTSPMHSVASADYALRCGLGDRLAGLVAHHTGARFEAEERNLLSDLQRFPVEKSPVAEALTAADLTTSPTGEPVSVDERISEILQRYKPEHPVHRAVARAQDVLRAQVARAYARAGLPM